MREVSVSANANATGRTCNCHLGELVLRLNVLNFTCYSHVLLVRSVISQNSLHTLGACVNGRGECVWWVRGVCGYL